MTTSLPDIISSLSLSLSLYFSFSFSHASTPLVFLYSLNISRQTKKTRKEKEHSNSLCLSLIFRSVFPWFTRFFLIPLMIVFTFTLTCIPSLIRVYYFCKSGMCSTHLYISLYVIFVLFFVFFFLVDLPQPPLFFSSAC